MAWPARKKNLVLFHYALALGAALLVTALLGIGLGRQPAWLPWTLFWLAGINLVAFFYYGYDKRCARSGRCRVPEVVLHGLTAAGGSLGSYAGMSVFRHKTIKGKFRILFWCIVALQVAVAGWLLKMAWRG